MKMFNCDRRIKIKQELLKKKYFKPIAIKWTKGNNFRRGINENNFVLTVSEVNEYGKFIGFLFKFQPILIHNWKSESGSVFQFDHKIDKNFIPENGKQFLIAIDNPAFIQQEKVDVIQMRSELRKKAEGKFLVKKESDSQRSSSSYDSSSEEENEDESFHSSEDVSKTQSSQYTLISKNQIEVKKKIFCEVIWEEIYYNVGVWKIKFYIFDL